MVKKSSKRTVAKHRQEPKCPVCSSRFRGGVAYIEFGAVIDDAIWRRKRITKDMVEGFGSIGFHGCKSDMSDSADFPLAENVKGGQIYLSFCSLACLRKWFEDIIDYLQRETGQRKNKRRGGIQGGG